MSWQSEPASPSPIRRSTCNRCGAPGSWPRALFNGAPNIERCDKLVQLIAKQNGLSYPVIDANVALVGELLAVKPQEGGCLRGIAKRETGVRTTGSSCGNPGGIRLIF